MDIQRQAFEKEYNKHHPNDMATRLQNGNYSGWVKQASWEMWQQAQKVAVPEWISLEDVEPNIGETVLICWSDGFDVEPEKDFMDVDIDSGVHYWSNFENDEPTHWMPIPQPPKAQEQVG